MKGRTAFVLRLRNCGGGKSADMVKDMTAGRPLKLLLAFGIPMLVGDIFQQLYAVVDTIIVGRGVGADALAAVGSTGALNWLVIGFITGLTHGFSIMISQNFGRGDLAAVKKSIAMSAYLSAFVSLVVSVLGVLFSKQMLTLMGTPEEILEDAALYISVIFGGTVPVILYNMTASVLRALGNSVTPLLVIVAGCGINIGLDLLFVLVFHWGVAGAAAATVLSQLSCGLLCLAAIARLDAVRFQKSDWSWDAARAGKLIRLGLPVGIMNSVTAVGGVVLQRVVNGLGAAMVAAYTVGIRIVSIADNAGAVIGMSLGTYVGQNAGAEKWERTRQGVRCGAVIELCFSGIVAFLFIVCGKALASLFVSQEDLYVVEAAYPYLWVCGSMMWSLVLLFVFRSSLQGLGNTVIPLCSGILELVMRLGMIFLLPESLGFYRICIAEVSAWCAAAVMLGIGYFVCIFRRQKDLPEKKCRS